MGCSRASAGLQVSLLLPGPADPIFGMLPPPASPRCSRSSPVTDSARSASPGASRARQGDGTQEGRGGREVPCPDKLELLQGETRMREERNRSQERDGSWERALGCRDPPDSPCQGLCQACLAEGEDTGQGDAGPRLHPSGTTASLPSSPHGINSLLSQPASGTAQQGDAHGKAGIEIQPPSAGIWSRDVEPGESLGYKLSPASARHSQPR